MNENMKLILIKNLVDNLKSFMVKREYPIIHP